NLLVVDENNHRILKFLKTNEGDIYLSKTELDFGLVDVGTSDTLDFMIKNSGLDTLFIDSIFVQSAHNITGNSFTVIDSSDTVTAVPPDSMVVSVAFSPAVDSTYSDSLVIYHRKSAASPTDSVIIYITGDGQPSLYGDVNLDGSITALDASQILKHVIGRIALGGIGLGAADVSGNGSVHAYDGALILQYETGLITSFPAGSTFVAKTAVNVDASAVLKIKNMTDNYVDYYIALNNVTDVYSTDITMTYDNTLFEFVEYSLLDAGKHALIEGNNDVETGELKLSMITLTPISETKDIIRLRFKIKKEQQDKMPVFTSFVINEEIIDVESMLNIPKVFALHQNYPNPFNPVTTIKFDLPKACMVTLKVYNILGQEIKTIIDEQKDAGYYSMKWDGRNNLGLKCASAMYIYRIKTDAGYVKAKKMVFLK
ncbi:T9SS type A sorting domain-containing protein, partial [bacterium]|nr:T9SS type A sorting domain-containing protein [bacterium]